MNRLKEIRARQLEIRTLLGSNSQVDLNAIETELRALEAEVVEIERRQAMLNGLGTGEIESRSLDSDGTTKMVDYRTMKDAEVRALPEYRTAFLKKLKGDELNDVEKRVLTTGSGATGAVPTTTENMVIDKLRQTSILFGKIGVSYIAGNLSFTVASAKNDAAWKAEGTDGTPADDTVVSVSLAGYELIKLVEISAAASAMTIPAFEQYIVDELGRKMLIAIENAILNGAGSGSNQPTGIFGGVTWTGANQVQYTTLSYDNIVDMTIKLPTMYHQRAEMVMSRAMALGAIRKIKDANGNPIFVPSTVAGQPSTVLGYPVNIDDYMPNDTDILFGDYAYYKMNFSKPIEIASDASVGFKSGKITYRGLAVADGKPTLSEAFVKLYK